MTDISALEVYAGELSEAAAQARAASQVQHDYVHGDSVTDVPTESGPLATLAKQAVQAQDKVSAALIDVALQMAGAMTYTTTAAGLAGTVNDGYFSVPSADSNEYLILYQNAAGVAVEKKRYPSAQAVAAFKDQMDQMDQRVDPIAEQQKRSRASLAPKETIADKTSGLAIEVLAEGMEEAALTKVGDAGRTASSVDTKRRRFIDYFQRAIGSTLAFTGLGIASKISSFFHWDVFGDLSFRSGHRSEAEVSVSGSGIRIGAPESVGADQYSAWRHRSGRLMSKVDREIYMGDLVYIGSDFIPPNRAPDVPAVIFAEDAPERVNRLIQGCASVAWVNGRIWVAFFGDVAGATESMTNFQVFKYSDDGGDTWVEWAYWVQNPAVARMNTSYLHVDKTGTLWAFSGTDHTFSSVSDDQLGCWAFSIKDPLADKPTVSSMWRASSLGYPGFLNPIDERIIMPMQIQETRTTIQDRKGVHLFEFDPACRSLTRVGRLPLTGNSDWQESSTVQLRDGRLMSIFRAAAAGQMVCYSAPGDFNNWSVPTPLSAVIGVNPGSRACLKKTPKGNLILVFNSSTGRQNMTLALLNDSGTTIIHSKLLQAEFTSYPDVAFDDAGNIIIVWDYSRAIERKIIISTISESDFVANGESAVQKITYVDDKKAV